MNNVQNSVPAVCLDLILEAFERRKKTRIYSIAQM